MYDKRQDKITLIKVKIRCQDKLSTHVEKNKKL